LKLEVGNLKKASAESETQKHELERQLSLVTQRISDLTKSFEDYRLKVQKLERQKKFWRTISLIELIIIIAGCAAYALSR